MEFEIIAARVQGLKWLTPHQGKILYDQVITHDVRNILELGFYHGVSSLYMAAALQQKEANGKVTTIDKSASRSLLPNIDTLSNELGLTRFIQPIYSDSSYTWELLKLLELRPRPSYDLIFIDGAHLWNTDALAFFLCDKMLNEGGFVIFDDLQWTMANGADPSNNNWTRKYTQAEMTTAQIQKVFDIVVKEHPNYGEFREEDGFGFARKIRGDQINFPKEITIVKPVMVTKEMMTQMMNRKK